MSGTQRSSPLVSRQDEVERAVREALATEAKSASVKETARDAELSLQRVKQMRAEASDPRASTLILLARRRPDLRAVLIELLHAEMGDGDKSPAQILAEIARMVAR